MLFFMCGKAPQANSGCHIDFYVSVLRLHVRNETLCVSSATSSETGVGAAWRGRPGLGPVSGTGLKGTPSGAVCVCTVVQWIPSYLPPARRPPPLPRQTCSWCSAPPPLPWKSSVLSETARDCMFSSMETWSGKQLPLKCNNKVVKKEHSTWRLFL